MLQHGMLAEVAEGAAEHRRVLLDDAGEGNHVDHSAQAVGDGMIERKGQRRQGLAAPGGYGQGEQPGRLGGLATYMVENPGTYRVDATFPGESRQMDLQPLAQRLERGPLPLRPRRLSLDATVKVVGIDKVGIHQAGKHHPRQQRKLEGTARLDGREALRQAQPVRQFDLALPDGKQRWQRVEGRLGQALAQGRALLPRHAVGQPGMMPGDAIGEQFANLPIMLSCDLSAPGSVVDPHRIAFEAALETRGVLAEVVEQTGYTGHVAGAERITPQPGERADLTQVFGKQLPIHLIDTGGRVSEEIHVRRTFPGR